MAFRPPPPRLGGPPMGRGGPPPPGGGRRPEDMVRMFTQQKKEEAARHGAELQRLHMQIQKQQQDIAQYEGLIRDLKAHLVQQQQGSSQHTQEVQQRDAQIADLTHYLQQRDAEIARLHGEHQALAQSASVGVTDQLKKKDQKIAQLVRVIEKVLEDTKKKLASTLQEKQHQAEKITHLESEVERTKQENMGEVRRQRAQIAELTKQLDVSKSAVSKSLGDCARKDERIQSLEREFQMKNAQVMDLTANLQQLQAAFQQAQEYYKAQLAGAGSGAGAGPGAGAGAGAGPPPSAGGPPAVPTKGGRRAPPGSGRGRGARGAPSPPPPSAGAGGPPPRPGGPTPMRMGGGGTAALQKKVGHLKSLVEEKEMITEIMKKQVEELTEQVHSGVGSVYRLQSLYDSKNRRIARLSQLSDALDGVTRMISHSPLLKDEQFRQKTGVVEVNRGVMQNLKQQVTTLQSQLDQVKEERLAALRNQRKLTMEVDKTTRSLKDLQNRQRVKVKQLQDAQLELRELQMQSKTLESQNTELERKCVQTDQELSAALGKIPQGASAGPAPGSPAARRQQVIKRSFEQLKKLQAEMTEKRKMIVILTRKDKKMTEQVRAYKTKVTDLESALNENGKKMQELYAAHEKFVELQELSDYQAKRVAKMSHYKTLIDEFVGTVNQTAPRGESYTSLSDLHKVFASFDQQLSAVKKREQQARSEAQLAIQQAKKAAAAAAAAPAAPSAAPTPRRPAAAVDAVDAGTGAPFDGRGWLQYLEEGRGLKKAKWAWYFVSMEKVRKTLNVYKNIGDRRTVKTVISPNLRAADDPSSRVQFAFKVTTKGSSQISFAAANAADKARWLDFIARWRFPGGS